MYNRYADLHSRGVEPVRFFCDNGVPRYCKYTPGNCANIYACESVLAEIACQGCGHIFKVAFTMDEMQHYDTKTTLAELIKNKQLHYGDPPNIDCCPAGPSMNSEPRRVIEYWSRKGVSDWERDPSLEVDITPGWVEQDV